MGSAARFKRFGLIIIAACFVAATLVMHKVHADPDDGTADGPDYSGISEGFSIGFANTYGYDYCGDAELGDRVRKVWWRFLDYCDLSPSQRSVIRENFEWATQNMPAQIPEMRKQWALPANPDSEAAESREFYGRFKCHDESYWNKKAKMEALLEAIEQRHAAPDTILPERCTH
jgi:hypothetical protein